MLPSEQVSKPSVSERHFREGGSSEKSLFEWDALKKTPTMCK